MQDVKEEVRTRLNIEEVIGEYIKLQRAGRSMKGLSPFTNEKTPSFMVSPDKHVWYDFSSNQGGDVFSFVMAMEGLDFKGALELLARKAGVDISQYQSGGKDLSKKKERLRSILQLAQQYYQQTLLKNQRALDYVIKTRGLNKKVIQDFSIGFAPDSPNATTDFLAKKGYSTSEIKAAGMANQRGGDLFRSRVMISLHDVNGQLIGFTGRYIGEQENVAKYLNTPQTLLYDKSRHIFGLHLAKESIRKSDRAVLVEGNLDVVSSHQAGILPVVAAAGTALTEQHLRTLKRFTPHIFLALDSDRAGLAATERTIPTAESLGISLKIVSLPADASDPDELIRKDPKLWQKAIKHSEAVVDWVLREYEQRYDISTAEGKRHFSSASLRVIKNLKDSVEQDHYLHIIAQKTNSRLSAVSEKLESVTEEDVNNPIKRTQAKKQSLPETSENSHLSGLLSLAVRYPEVRGLLIEVDAEVFEEPPAIATLDFLKNNPKVDFSEKMPPQLHQYETYVKILLFRAEARYGSWSELDRYDEAAKLVKLLKNQTQQHMKQRLQKELQQAEASGETKKIAELKQALNQLIKGTH